MSFRLLLNDTTSMFVISVPIMARIYHSKRYSLCRRLQPCLWNQVTWPLEFRSRINEHLLGFFLLLFWARLGSHACQIAECYNLVSPCFLRNIYSNAWMTAGATRSICVQGILPGKLEKAVSSSCIHFALSIPWLSCFMLVPLDLYGSVMSLFALLITTVACALRSTLPEPSFGGTNEAQPSYWQALRKWPHWCITGVLVCPRRIGNIRRTKPHPPCSCTSA